MRRKRRWERPVRCMMAAVVTWVALLAIGISNGGVRTAQGEEVARDGSSAFPLRVMLIPADTGADSTLDDFKPVFHAITKNFGIHFDLRVATSYSAVVEGLVARRVDVAFVGPVAFHQASQRQAAELLAVAVKEKSCSYHAVILARKDSAIKQLSDLRGRKIALGDINSTTSFRFPVAMLVNAGVDPVIGLDRAVITGSHSNALAALREGQVDAAGCSLAAYEKGLNSGAINLGQLKVLAVSPAIPNPPLVMHPGLPSAVKRKLRDAFCHIHQAPGVTPDTIRGYGGDRYDRFDVEFPRDQFDQAMAQLEPVTQRLIASMIERAADR